MSFDLTVPFPGAVPRSAHLPGLDYCHPELRAALEAAVAARARLDECRSELEHCGLPTPHPARTELEARVREAERAGAEAFERAQLLAAEQADRWAEHLHRMYYEATARFEAARTELEAAYGEAVGAARLLPMVKRSPHTLTTPHGGRAPAVATLLSPAMTTLRERTAGGLPGITE